MKEKYYIHKKKEIGFVSISRHRHPDFVAMQALEKYGKINKETCEMILKEYYIIKEVMI